MLYACYYQIITHHKLKKILIGAQFFMLMDYTKTIKNILCNFINQ